MYIFYTITFIT